MSVKVARGSAADEPKLRSAYPALCVHAPDDGPSPTSASDPTALPSMPGVSVLGADSRRARARGAFGGTSSHAHHLHARPPG